MRIASIGIDLGKTTFHLVALGERNKLLLRRKFSRSHLADYASDTNADERCTHSLQFRRSRFGWNEACSSARLDRSREGIKRRATPEKGEAGRAPRF